MKREDTRTPEQKQGQNGSCPTVVVKLRDGGGEVTINAHDYNPDKHGKVIRENDATEVDPGAGNVEVAKPTDWAKKTVAEMKDILADKGVAFDTDARKDDLIALCVEHVDGK